ncbi:MAG: hypothetical protein NVSMB16_15910 [Acidimicrobiales bacterium]
MQSGRVLGNVVNDTATHERASAGTAAARQLALMILAAPHRYSDAAVTWAEVERDRRALGPGGERPGDPAVSP